MLTLCLNTAGHINTLALVKDRQLIAEESWLSERNETETILPKLELLLLKVKIKIEEIEALHVIQGVGGFTSLRVGISIVNTIAYSQNIPIYGSSVFELWSNRASHLFKKESNVAILIDAGRQECFYYNPPLNPPLLRWAKKVPLDTGNTRDFCDYFAPQIIPNTELTRLQENFWIGEVNERQRQLLSPTKQEYLDLRTPGEAFTQIDLSNKKPHQSIEPWYGREPNVSLPKN